MDAQDSSADVVKVEASGGGDTKAVAVVRARSVDYQPIINETVADLIPNTAHKRRKVYAHARVVIAHGLMSMGLAEAIIEVEKLALDLAIERVEHRWRLKGAARKLSLESAAAEQATPVGARLTGGRGARGFRPPLEIGWCRFRPLSQVAEALVHAVSATRGIRWCNEARRPTSRTPVPQRRGELLARSRPAPVRARFNMRSAIAVASTVGRLSRGVAETVGVAVALPVIATIIVLVSHIDSTVTHTGAGSNPVGRSSLDPSGGPRVRTATAANDVSARARARPAPTHAGFRAADDAPAPSRANGAASEEGDVACGGASMSRDGCARETAGSSAPVEAPQTQAAPPWLESYIHFSDMSWGSNALRGPTVATPDVQGGRAAAYAAPGADAALASPAAAPRAAATQPPRSAPNPIDPKVVALIASGNQAALKGDLDRATRDFSEAIRTDPKYPDSYFARGQIYFKLGETERAIADYSAALAHAPQQAAVLRARGMAHLYLGKNDLALADLSKAIELGEKDPQLLAPIELFYARRSRESIYESKQQYDLEIADCTALLDSYAHNRVLAEALAANYGTAGTADTLAKIYRQRANALAKTSSMERAVADLTEAIRLSSDRGYAALLDRAKLHELLGRRDLAVADARAALKIRPSSEEARLALSRLSGRSKSTPASGS